MSDAYQGDSGLMAPTKFHNFDNAFAVVVSGSGPNACGHLLLFVDGQYFHVIRLRSYPNTMNQAQYDRYLTENNKTELERVKITVPNPTAATNELNRLLKKKWTWGGVPHNCVAFVEQVVQAGGSKFGLFFNCPAILDD